MATLAARIRALWRGMRIERYALRVTSYGLRHELQAWRRHYLHIGERNDFLCREAGGDFKQREVIIVPLQQGQIGDDIADATLPGQRVGALLLQLRPTLAVAVLHDDDQFGAT